MPIVAGSVRIKYDASVFVFLVILTLFCVQSDRYWLGMYTFQGKIELFCNSDGEDKPLSLSCSLPNLDAVFFALLLFLPPSLSFKTVFSSWKGLGGGFLFQFQRSTCIVVLG